MNVSSLKTQRKLARFHEIPDNQKPTDNITVVAANDSNVVDLNSCGSINPEKLRIPDSIPFA